MERNSFSALCKVLLMGVLCGSSGLMGAQTVIHVEQAGTLPVLMASGERSVKLTGEINGTDVKFLREQTTTGVLNTLDMEEVRIVSGGTAYYESLTTMEDVIGERMFSECRKLQNVVLPATLRAIGSNAFSRSGLRKIDIPNTVTHLGFDAFAYCSALTQVVIGSRVGTLAQGVFYSSPVRTAHVKPLTPPAISAYLFSSNPAIRVYTQALEDYRASGWASYGTLSGNLEELYPLETDSSEVVNNLRSIYFEDAACTRLRAAYQAMSDEELQQTMTEGGMPQFMCAIALKLKNREWAAYEQEFRIHAYKAYSDAAWWNERLKSTGGSYMGNPTGICAEGYDPLYVFVEQEIPEDATLYITACKGNEMVSTAKAGKKLQQGVNIVDGVKDALYYIVYTADTRSQTRTLGEWPEITIHIQGGQVNGYYDAARHNDRDYVALLKAARHELFTIKGTESLLNFKTSTYRTVFPRSIDRTICWFDSVTVWQKELMGMCASVASGAKAGAPFYLSGGEAFFPLYYNNPNFAIQGKETDAGYANSSYYRTSYNSVECIRNSFDVSRWELDDWCVGHECGHNNQSTINLEGCGEASNNLFSNVIRYQDGLATSLGSTLATVMNDYAYRVPYISRSVDSKMRMYYQLYLYYHLAQKNTAFYPTLFQELRKDPIVRWKNTDQSLLKFVRTVCRVAQEDLTEFFRAWGFFEPCDMEVEDYGLYRVVVRQSDINRTLQEISQYPANNEILYIEDRVKHLLTTDFLTTAGKKRRGSEVVGQCGDLGQFTDYVDGAAGPSAYTYLQADSLYAMQGTGGIGFMVQDSLGHMLYASNALNFCIPSCVGNDIHIYSVDPGGEMKPVEKGGEGAETVHLTRSGTLRDSLSAHVLKATISGSINGTDFKYMRQLINENNLAGIHIEDVTVQSGGESYYENYRSIANGIGSHAFYGLRKLITIRLPKKITRIETNAFARTGLKEIHIPENVTQMGGDAFAYCEGLSRVIIGSRMRTLGQGVFYSSPVRDAYVRALTPPTVASYLFSSKPVIHVYASALAAYQQSAWANYGTLVGDLDAYEDIVEVRMPLAEEPAPADNPLYDLMGRKVTSPQPGTIYIQNGKKVIMK